MADVTVIKDSVNEDLKTCLSRHKKDDKDLYNHVSQVMSHIVKHCPQDSLNKLEEVSYLIKNKDTIPVDEFLKTSVSKDYAKPASDETKQATAGSIDNAKKFFAQVKAGENDEEGEEGGGGGAIGNLPDILSDAKIWEWAGVGFGEYETMLLQKSLKQLITKTGSPQIKFWGKILGTEFDYYIAEGVLEAGEGGEETPVDGFEDRGTGVNKYVYWACNNPLQEWVQLPDLKPNDIIEARSVKVHFTGDLDRKIFTNPFFNKPEKVYLRVQIARITQSTSLVPKGLHRLQEENDREIEDNTPEEGDIVKPTVNEMADLSRWVHHTPSILLQGRLKHKEPKPDEGAEEEEGAAMKREIEKDPWEPRLKPVTSDKKTIGGMPAWILRGYNLNENYIDEKTGKASKHCGTVVVKSMWWPGSFTFYQGDRTSFIYCGQGLKRETQTYYPIQPPVMVDDQPDKKCYDEPNPTEEWLKEKAAHDAKKKQEGAE